MAAFSLLLPVQAVPWFFNLVGMALLLGPALFLFSGRFDHVAPSQWGKVLLALIYVGLTSAGELYVNLTNSQWHLALLTLLVLIARPASTARWRVFDIATVVLCGLTGPFCLLLAPIAAIRWLQVRSRLQGLMTILLGACCVVQGVILLTGERHVGRNLGATPSHLVHILAGRVFVSGEVGQHGYKVILQTQAWGSHVLPLVVLTAGIALIVYAVVRGSWELRFILLYGFMVVAAGLAQVAWPMIRLGGDDRYFAYAILGFLAALAWSISRRRSIAARAAGLAGLGIFFVVGMPADWSYPPFFETGFAAQAEAFNELPAGQQMTFQLNPPGWSMTLSKRPKDRSRSLFGS